VQEYLASQKSLTPEEMERQTAIIQTSCDYAKECCINIVHNQGMTTEEMKKKRVTIYNWMVARFSRNFVLL
jgi:hypothetical protein